MSIRSPACDGPRVRFGSLLIGRTYRRRRPVPEFATRSSFTNHNQIKSNQIKSNHSKSSHGPGVRSKETQLGREARRKPPGISISPAGANWRYWPEFQSQDSFSLTPLPGNPAAQRGETHRPPARKGRVILFFLLRCVAGNNVYSLTQCGYPTKGEPTTRG
eukprot:1175608-Prorocentrum_minimum.AAC.4